jgi:hypothetical protein
MKTWGALLLFSASLWVGRFARAQEEEPASKGGRDFLDLLGLIGRNEIIEPIRFNEPTLREMRAYGWQQTLEQPVSQELYWLVLSLIGDEEARRLIVAKIARVTRISR